MKDTISGKFAIYSDIFHLLWYALYLFCALI